MPQPYLYLGDRTTKSHRITKSHAPELCNQRCEWLERPDGKKFIGAPKRNAAVRWLTGPRIGQVDTVAGRMLRKVAIEE